MLCSELLERLLVGVEDVANLAVLLLSLDAGEEQFCYLREVNEVLAALLADLLQLLELHLRC